MSVTDTDLGWKHIQRELRIFQELEIFIGFQGIHGEVALVATHHEFGTEDMPARPFLRSAFDVAQAEIGKMVEKGVNSIMDDGKTALEAANKLGLFGVTLVKKRIQDSPAWAEELAAVTIKAKKSTKPLVDTAQMINSVTYVIKQNGEQVAAG